MIAFNYEMHCLIPRPPSRCLGMRQDISHNTVHMLPEFSNMSVSGEYLNCEK